MGRWACWVAVTPRSSKAWPGHLQDGAEQSGSGWGVGMELNKGRWPTGGHSPETLDLTPGQA